MMEKTFNLIPEDQKKKIRTEYKLRRAGVAMFFLLATILIAAVFQVPFYVFSQVNYRDLSEEIKIYKKNSEGRENFSVVAVEDIKEKSKFSALDKSSIPIHTLFQAIISERLDIKIQELTYGKGADEKVIINVSGIAKGRESLTSFSKRIQENPLFSEVELPISNFTKDKDIDFSLKIRGNF